MRIRTTILSMAAVFLVGSANLFGQAPSPPSRTFGVIRGIVTDDSSGNPLPKTLVGFYSIRGMWTIALAYTDPTGSYSIRLDTGRYIAVALRLGYFPEWFDNVRTRDSATVIPVAAGDTVEADFRLHRIPVPVLVKVGGMVTDSVTGSPLEGALVVFYRPFHWFPVERAMDATVMPTGIQGGPAVPLRGPGATDRRGIVWYGFSDSSGHYTATVPAGVSLIAAALKYGYVPEFYDDKHSPFEANKLVFINDTSEIDFHLIPVPPALDIVSGQVVDTAGTGVPSHVLLVQQTGHGPWRIRYRMSDSTGHYLFNHLTDGSYIVEALPVERHLPAWYDADSCGVLDWRKADLVHVTGTVTGINICVRPLPPPGIASVTGRVYDESQPAAGGHGIGGAIVCAVSTASGQVLGFDVTDSDGLYTIADLPAGAYVIVVDKEGFTQTMSPERTLGPANNYLAQASIPLLPESPLGVGPGDRAVPRTFVLEQNYPNPFNPSSTIGFQLPVRSVVTLTIYDLLGRAVGRIAAGEVDPGYRSVVWDASGFAGGVYFYRLDATSARDPNISFSAVRKMVLVK